MSRFDRFMVHVDIGTDEKLARLTATERLCHITGVLAIAAKSPIRGRLLVGDHQAGPDEIARRASLPPRVAESTIAKLIEVGVLVRDDENDCLRVYNWERFNPEPRPDPGNAKRQARYRERQQSRNAMSNAMSNDAVTRVTSRARSSAPGPPEGERKIEEPPLTPPAGGNGSNADSSMSKEAPTRPSGHRKADKAAFEAEIAQWTTEHLPGSPPQAVAGAVSLLASHNDGAVTAADIRQLAASSEIWAYQLNLTQGATT